MDPTPQAEPAEEDDGRMVIRWAPLRSDGTERLELTDCVFDGLPPSPSQEQNQESRVSLGLLTEILALRNRLDVVESILKEKGIEV